MVCCALASSLRGAGAAWSMKNTQLGALTRPAPSSSICYGQRAGAVLRDRHVDGGHDDLAGHDGVEAGVGGEDLLGERERRHEGFPAVPAPSGAAAASSASSAAASLA